MLSGSGTTTLSGANTFGGGTTLSAGTLLAGNNAALGTGALNVAGAGGARRERERHGIGQRGEPRHGRDAGADRCERSA